MVASAVVMVVVVVPTDAVKAGADYRIYKEGSPGAEGAATGGGG